jgi:hypothetical protein
MTSLDQFTLPSHEEPQDEGPFDFADPNSPLAPYYGRIAHVVAAALLGLTFLLVSSGRVWHTDVWGHLRFGEYIVKERRLPTHEMFSGDFADQDAPFVNYYWLGQAGAYLLFELGQRLASPDPESQLGGGLLLLGLTHALLVTLRLFLLLVAFRRVTGSLAFATLGVALVFLLGYFYHIGVLRPQILGEVAFAALLVPLSRPTLSRRALILVPVILVLWANCHGSFVVGLGVLGLALAGQVLLVAWRAVRQGAAGLVRIVKVLATDLQTRRLSLVLLLSTAAVVVLTPDHLQLFVGSWELSHNPNIATMNEWRALPFNWFACVLMFGPALLAVTVLVLDRKQVSPLQVLLLVLFCWQAITHARMFVWWGMIATWVLLPHLRSVWRRGLPAWLAETDTPNLRRTIMAAMVAVVFVLWTPTARWLSFGEAPRGREWVHRQTPLKVAAYLREQYERDPSLARGVFCSETVGDYLLWDLRLDPPLRFSCYSHVHLLTPEHWYECLVVKTGAPGWEDVLCRWKVQFLVVEPSTWHTHLIEQITADPAHWEVVPDMGALFMAKYVGPRS